jgi:PKD repeat protein
MKRLITLFIVIAFASVGWLNAQTNLDFAYQTLEERGEIYFQFDCSSPQIIHELNDVLSIDGRDGTTYYAYANESGFEEFLSYDLLFQPVESYYDKTKALTMATTVAEMANWDRYPTHDVYVQMMNDFVTDYPDLCALETIGQSVNGVDLIALRISDNVDTDEDEPEYFWTNTMHGDELAGYVLSLRFADYLLSNYGTDPQVTLLVDGIEIYVNPLANPDGTFYNSDGYTDVSGSRRANANGIDLNRNFPDQEDGQNPDENPTQTETQLMIDYANLHDFVMSANTHGGAELINYPWDNWTSAENAHADDDWWQHVSWIYANNAQNDSPTGYFTDQSGVTEGGDWYVITGSRQDYMNYFQQCRETTIELSSTKKLDVEDLPDFWNYNKQAMLDYTEQVLYGVRGIVTDACTDAPLGDVRVEISGHDQDSSHVYSSAPIGNYHRPIYEGNWDLTFSKPGYQSQTHTVNVVNNDSTRLNVQLIPDNVGVPDFTADQTSVFEGEPVNFTDQSTGTVTDYNWTFPGGTPNASTDVDPSVVYNSAGTYDVSLEITSEGCNVSELKENYLTVQETAPPAADFEASATTVTVGSTVDFTDLSSGNPSAWNWTFNGGTPASETAQHPSITYNTVGTYDVSLAATNAYGSDDTTKTDYITVIVEYCDAGSDDGTTAYISQLEMGDINNPSGENTYTDFSDQSTDVVPGGNQTFTVTSENNYNMAHVLIWADWNRDGDFYDTDESLFTSAQGGGPFSGGFTVPASVTSGDVRIRVRCEIEGYGDVNDPCGYSDYGEVEDYTLNVLSPDVPPIAEFSASPTNSCDGVVQFTDESSYPESWNWDFGDGNTSTAQNPLHTYSSDGTYTVTLTVSNAHGADDTTRTDYITINMPDAPVIADEENCGAGSVTLSATASGEVNWYDAETGGNLLETGADYTDNYSATTTLYADNTVINPQNYASGKTDNTGDGGYYTNASQYGLIFDAYTDFVIESVKVYADGAGDRTITLLDNTDTEIASTTVTIPDGESVVDLNFTVPAGTNYTLMGPESPNLYRNGGGGVDLPYPYEITDVLSIHDNTAGLPEYYYFFYDWQVRVDEVCVSPRTAATVTIHDLPTVDLGADQEICEGNDYTFDAGSGFADYLWNTGANTQTIVADTTGNYSVEVTDANGCNATDDVNLTVNPVPVLSFISTQENGNNCDGSVTVTVTDGDYPPLTYVWDDPGNQTTATATDLCAGTYCVTVINGYDCNATGCETVSSTSPSPIADFEADTTEACVSLTVQFTDLSANDPTSWEWDFGDGNTSTEEHPQHTYSSPGTYTVELTATNSYGSDTHSITDYITVYDEITIYEGSESVSCNGYSDADITAALSGGEGTYSYYWEDGSGTNLGTTQTLSDLPAGNYYLTVTDGAGCTASGTYTVTEPDPLEVNVTTTNESAAGACDGTATANVTGGTPSYLYTWILPVPHTQTEENLCAGSYQVTVSDAHGCTAINSGEVLSGPQPPVADFDADATEGCASFTVQFTDLSSNDPTSWEWDFGDGNTSTEQHPQHTYTVMGTYTVILTATNDYGDDVEQKSGYITVYPALEVSDGNSSVACYGNADGSLTADVTGGEGTYSYTWEDEAGSAIGNTETVSDLPAGTYYLTVSDAVGCTDNGVYTITQPDELQVSITTTDETVYGACDGTATANVSGGTPDYTYTWMPEGWTQTITDLCPGNYDLTVTDMNGCDALAQGTVGEGPQPPDADFEADVTEGCGSLSVQFTDLSAHDPTSWEWDFGDGNTSTDQHPQHTYSPGTYTVELTASNSYGSDTHSITGYITVYDELVVSDGSGDVSCYGDSDGSLTADVTGGEGTYYYHWESATGVYEGNTETITGLSAGTYYLTVTDAAGCSDIGTYTVSEPDLLEVNVTTINTSAAGVCDGSATANVSGGITPIVDYLWSTGSTVEGTHDALCDGDICVTITDSHGCTASDCGYIADGPQPPDADFEADITEGCGTLTVQFTDLSSNDPTSWSWDFGDGVTSSNQHPQHTYVLPGVYTVEMTATNAIGSDDVVYTDYIVVHDNVIVNDGSYTLDCHGDNDGTLTADISGGSPDYAYLWENAAGDPAGTTETISGLTGGTYYLTVTDVYGCQGSGVYTVEEPPALSLTVVTTDETVEGACDGTAYADVTGGTPGYSYTWNLPAPHTQNEEDLWAGTFCVTVTDEHGCTVSDCGVVEQGPPPPPAEFEADVTEGCEPLSVQFTALHPEDITSWSWDFGDGVSSAEQNAEHTYEEAGAYTVELTVEHATSGTSTETITDYITVLERPELNIDVTHETSTGSCDGEMTVVITGNDAPYSVSWSNDETTETIDNLCVGLYSVAVTGSNGCSNTETAAIETITILESQTSNGVVLYPNPADEVVYIESKQRIQKIELYTVDGRLVNAWNPESQSFEIPVENLNGLYMVRMTDKSGSVTNHQVIVKK